MFTYLMVDIHNTEKSLAISLIDKPMNSVEENLSDMVHRIENRVVTTSVQLKNGFIDTMSVRNMNAYFAPMITHSPEISSTALVNQYGYEFDIMPIAQGFHNREVISSDTGMYEKWREITFDSTEARWKTSKQWVKPFQIDPRERDFYKGAIRNSGEVYWTEPYRFITTGEVGMSATLEFPRFIEEKPHVLSLDITLKDLTKLTQELNVSDNGKTFIVTKSEKYVGLPNDSLFTSEKAISDNIMKHYDSVNIQVVQSAIRGWKTTNDREENTFEFKHNGNIWWGKLAKFELSEENFLIVGVILPESDFLSDIQRTKRVVIGAFIFILILTGFVMYSYAQSKKANGLLARKNHKIVTQSSIISQKNKEIIDSINYAKRIQKAILPPDELIEQWLPESFILYKPKDIVAGDFYWMEKKGNKLLFAAADCTGHGVPGAMVSVVCNNGLNRSVREYDLSTPSDILDRTRDIVVHEFGDHGSDVKDGMDIALCSLDGNRLEYAGANNPLWIIRNGSDAVEEIKADKQPVGVFQNSKPYASHTIELQKGDTIYVFSDGYVDQFGGEKGKKFKAANLKRLLLSIQSESMERQKTIIDEAFENWKGELEQVDDVCIIGVRY